MVRGYNGIMSERSAKLAVAIGVTALVGGAIYLMSVRGSAILLDMAVSAVAFLCL